MECKRKHQACREPSVAGLRLHARSGAHDQRSHGVCRGVHEDRPQRAASESKQVFAEYGIAYKLHANYEADHLISLELGGSNAIANLWPESSLILNGSLTKDKFENYLHAQV